MAQKKQAAKKTAGNNKRGPKAKQVVEEKPEEVEASDDNSDAEEEQNGVNSDDGSNSEAEGAADLVGSEAEESEDADEDEDDDDDDDNEEDDEVEPGEVTVAKINEAESDDDSEEADSDEEPSEEPISKKEKKSEPSPKKGGIPKVPVARIPVETPKEQIVFVTNLPDQYKHVDLVALFAKFGPIAVVNRLKAKAGGNHVQIAFESPEGVDAALAAKDKALTLDGKVLQVARPMNKNELNERTVVIGLIGTNATKENISEHFKNCGAIDSVTFSHNRVLPTAYLRFKDVSSVPKALKLHGSELNSRFITVREESYKTKVLKKPNYTVTVANTGHHESYKTDTVEKIFKKYGELEDVDVVCTKSILAFVTYKTVESAEKALKQLNGKTIGDLELKMEPYYHSSSVRKVLVTNLHLTVAEEQLNNLFSDCGKIESIKMMGPKALIQFDSDEGFCKAFLLNETVLQGQPIFLEPNSMLKHKVLQQKSHKFQGAGAGGGGGYKKFNNSGFGAKNNNKPTFNKKPFNKRQAQDNGSTPQSFKKAKKV